MMFVLACWLIAWPLSAQQTQPMHIDDLFCFKRVADPQMSPDSKWVVYTLTTIDDPQKNKSFSNLWMASTDSKTRKQLTTTTRKDRQPVWSPDGKSILFVSTRSGTPQLWIIDLGGGEARQLTTISTGAADPAWSRDGKRIAFVSAVWPEFSHKPFQESDKLNKEKIDEQESSPVKVRVFKRLFYRHWDDYVEDKRQHLFVCDFADGKAGAPRDVTPGDFDAFPTSDTFSASVNYTFSPDGTHLLFTSPPREHEAWSTNYDIWRVAVDGKGKPENLTRSNKAADGGPQFSPDGKKLAYRAQRQPGYEADRWELMVADCDPDGKLTGPAQVQALGKDLSVEEFIWQPDSKAFYFTADWQALVPIFQVGLGAKECRFAQRDPGQPVKAGDCVQASLSIGRVPGQYAYTSASLNGPPTVFVEQALSAEEIKKGNISRIALGVDYANYDLQLSLASCRTDTVTVKGADGTPLQMWIMYPPGFDDKKKWPVAYLVHGGPQGAWHDGWSYRWNPKLWAAQGYIVALPNPRGSTGFGQKYVDEITGDWGGKCYVDLMKGVDYLESLPYVDKDRIGAAGASFGGYMMNWFAVNTGRFKCLITHCSVWNFESMYATTDELWFDEWEHGGPPWGKNRASYEKHSPHKFAGNLAKFKTPMLVIQNDLDFRCPIGQGHELFTTLQRLGVTSKMINFPDEGHWVLKPANSAYWHREVFAWLKKYVPSGPR
jgi:dipeptidyl aminopeptidase/acylaminoacyl peptidase